MKKRFAKMFTRLTLVLLVAACFAVACLIPRQTAAYAFTQESLPLCPQRVGGDQSVAYKHIEKITSFDAGDALYFSDGTDFYKNNEKTEDEGGATASAVIGGKLVYADKDGGIYYKDDLLTDLADGAFNALAAVGQTLYAASADENKILTYAADFDQDDDALSLVPSLTYSCGGLVQSLCATGSAVYYKLKNSTDIYTLSGGGVKKIEDGVENLRALSAGAFSGLLYCLTNTQIISYNAQGGILTRQGQTPFSGGEYIAAGTDHVYAAAADGGTFTVYRTDLELSGLPAPFIASRGDFDYFYRSPFGVSSRFGGIYVADTNNNRVSVLSDSGVLHYESYNDDGAVKPYEQPKSAALSTSGDLYIAHKNNVTNNNTGKTISLQDEENNKPLIQKIVLDGAGNIYALAKYTLTGKNCVYSLDAGLSAFTLLSLDSPLAIGVQTGGGVLFLEEGADGADGSLKNLKGQTVASCPSVKDFCVDFSGKIFAIDLSGSLISVSGGVILNHGGSYDTLALSNAANNLAGFGDILLVESATHSLKRIPAVEAGVADMSALFPAPDAENDFNPHKKTDNLAASVRFDTPLFTLPTEAAADYTLLKGNDVFIRYDIDAPQDMYFVAAEYKNAEAGGTTAGRLVYGYVYKAALNTPYEYIQPQKNNGRVVLDTEIYKYIYKYPSLYANPVREVKIGDPVKLLPFADNISTNRSGWFQDINGYKWVRIEMNVESGSCEGYMPELALSWSLFTGEGSQVNDNATIKENAPLYIYNRELDRYEYLDSVSFLKKGLRVEVKTPFDSSAEFTRVYFSRTNEKGETEVIDIECYVETKYINFDGVDVLQIVALAGIGIALILIIVLAVWMLKRRKRRRTAQDK